MTVYAPVGKLRKKVAIPLLIFFAVVGISIWVPPVREYLREYYFTHEILGYAVKSFTSFVSLMGFLMVLCWTLWGDVEDDKTD